MFCPNCGTQVEQGRFCPNCGCPLEQVKADPSLPAEETLNPANAVTEEAAPEPAEEIAAPKEESAAQATLLPTPEDAPSTQSYQQFAAYQPTIPDNYGAPLQQDDPVRRTIRSLASSPLFLVAAIAFSVSLVLTLIGNVQLSGTAFRQAWAFLQNYGADVPEIPAGIETAMSTSRITSAISGMIPSIVIGVGLWMTYAAAKRKNDKLLGSGLTVLRVMSIIELVLLCVGAGIVLLVLMIIAAVFGFSAADAGNETATIVLMVVAIAFAVLAAVFVLFIVFYVKVRKTIDTVRESLRSGVASDKVSTFVAVILFVSAAAQVLSFFTLLGAQLLLSQAEVLAGGRLQPVGMLAAALLCLVSAATDTIFGVLILKYRNAMRQLAAGGV